MTRVHVICEGQTEEMFVNEVLVDWFNPKGIFLYPSLLGKPGHKGGNVCFNRLLTDARGRLLSDNSAYCTTLFDFYGLPPVFPGKQAASAKAKVQDKAACVLNALSEALKAKLGHESLRRFFPYVQMYEFEGLLFSDPIALAKSIDSGLAEQLTGIRRRFETPEEINDSPETAPSKRIENLYPPYDKPLHGSLAAKEIGLDAIRSQCRLFDGWLTQIENLPPLTV